MLFPSTAREIGFYGAGMGREVGEVMQFGGASAPAGFLECDGASLLKADYPALYATIGGAHGTADGTHFNVPDFCGKFARGYDHGAGNDPDAGSRTAAAPGGATGDNVGSIQADVFKSHIHTTSTSGGAGSVVNSSTSTNNAGGTTGGSGGNETRPLNVSLMFVIKY